MFEYIDGVARVEGVDHLIMGPPGVVHMLKRFHDLGGTEAMAIMGSTIKPLYETQEFAMPIPRFALDNMEKVRATRGEPPFPRIERNIPVDGRARDVSALVAPVRTLQ